VCRALKVREWPSNPEPWAKCRVRQHPKAPLPNLSEPSDPLVRCQLSAAPQPPPGAQVSSHRSSTRGYLQPPILILGEFEVHASAAPPADTSSNSSKVSGGHRDHHRPAKRRQARDRPSRWPAMNPRRPQGSTTGATILLPSMRWSGLRFELPPHDKKGHVVGNLSIHQSAQPIVPPALLGHALALATAAESFGSITATRRIETD
jgi:hypothetical protein